MKSNFQIIFVGDLCAFSMENPQVEKACAGCDMASERARAPQTVCAIVGEWESLSVISFLLTLHFNARYIF